MRNTRPAARSGRAMMPGLSWSDVDAVLDEGTRAATRSAVSRKPLGMIQQPRRVPASPPKQPGTKRSKLAARRLALSVPSRLLLRGGIADQARRSKMNTQYRPQHFRVG